MCVVMCLFLLFHIPMGGTDGEKRLRKNSSPAMSDGQTDRWTNRQIDRLPELSASLSLPQQRYLLHCFWTFSLSAQWNTKMNRPGKERDSRDTVELRKMEEV